MPSILPQLTEQTVSESTTNGTTAFYFDFKLGDFVFSAGVVRKVTDLARTENKIEKLLRTALNRYAIYDGTTYGMNYHNWIWQIRDRDFIESELTRETREKLSELDEVTAVGEITCSFEGRALTVYVELSTIYGKVKETLIL